MRWPIDMAQMTFMTAGDPRPVYVYDPENRETRQQRTDANGVPLFSVRVFASGEEVGQVIEVKTAGEPTGIRRNMPVRMTGLSIQPWQLKSGKSGFAFRAARIEPITTKS
jgi:hypothetical protein